jgi:hypothetical protein
VGVLGACASSGSADGNSTRRAPAGTVLFTPDLSGVDPRFLPELERVGALISDGNYAAAGRVLDGVLARDPGGAALEAARSYQRMLDLDPSYLPALQALARAVDSGADREARAILDRMALRQPTGRVLELANAYRRILDGRAVVAGLRLSLECRPEPAESLPKNAPPGARFSRLFLVVESGLRDTVELETGPATLFVTRSVVVPSGLERDAIETRTFDDLRRITVEPGGTAEISLALFFVSAGEGELASRMRFEFEMRSGSARILPGGDRVAAREVPVMRLRVADAEETALPSDLATEPSSRPEDLVALATGASTIDVAAALRIAVRIGPVERERALDLLAPVVRDLPTDAVRALVPALRWIAVTSEPGGSPEAWRAWLRARDHRKAEERPNLLLPRSRPEGAPTEAPQ